MLVPLPRIPFPPMKMFPKKLKNHSATSSRQLSLIASPYRVSLLRVCTTHFESHPACFVNTVQASSSPAETAGGLCLVCMCTPQCPAHLAGLTQRDHSQSPSSAARPRCCCCQSQAWRPGRWSLRAAHCLGCLVLYGRPLGSEAGGPVWIQCSAKTQQEEGETCWGPLGS